MTTIKFSSSLSGDPEDLLQQAVHISDGDTDEETGPPLDGMAYLKQVIKERRRIPGTVTAMIDPVRIQKPVTGSSFFIGSSRSKPSVSAENCPSLRWQNQQTAEFSDVRLKLARHCKLLRSKGESIQTLKLPDKENEMLWCLFLYGSSVWKLVVETRKTLEEEESNDEDDKLDKDGKDEKEKKDKENDEDSAQILSTVLEKSKYGTEPNLKVVLSMPVHLVERILEYQVAWLQLTGWRAEYGAWIYSLLSRIEKPLNPDLGSVLRDLALFCSQERNKLLEKSAKESKENHENKDGEEQPGDKDIAAFNLFICLVSRYFDQADLADTSS